MEQRSSSLEEIILHTAMVQSHLHYGGQGPAKNPLEILMDEEFDRDDRAKQAEAVEVLSALLRFAADGVNIPGIQYEWKRFQKRVKDGQTYHYQREDRTDDIPWPFVEIRDASGATISRWEPARLKSIYKARPNKGEKGPSLEIEALVIHSESAAIRVGTRVISLAVLAGVNDLRIMSGQGIAIKLGVTRQAVSLTNKAMDQKIREATGGKSNARGLRPRADPRKGSTLAKSEA